MLTARRSTGLVSIVNGTVQFNTLDSFVGRLWLRFGTTAQYGNVVYQPFVALSVWHEFYGNAAANYSAIGLAAPSTATINVPNIGTYGQYSLGVSGQVVNTGWLGFARVDYRNGNRLEGWSETGGIRYQYTPGSGPMDMAFAMVDALDHAMAYAKVTKAAPVFMAMATPFETLGPVSLDLLGRALKDAGDPAGSESVLLQAQQRHPGDVWINYDLARSLEKLARRDEAIRYYTAARAIRRETAHELAHALRDNGERDEEIAILRATTQHLELSRSERGTTVAFAV